MGTILLSQGVSPLSQVFMEGKMSANNTYYNIVRLLDHGKGVYSYWVEYEGEQFVLKHFVIDLRGVSYE